jgi:hypothetical protein
MDQTNSHRQRLKSAFETARLNNEGVCRMASLMKREHNAAVHSFVGALSFLSETMGVSMAMDTGAAHNGDKRIPAMLPFLMFLTLRTNRFCIIVLCLLTLKRR